MKQEAIGLLGIEREPDAGLARRDGERSHARHDLAQHALALILLEARM